MKKKYLIGAVLAFAIVGNSYAQDDANLVENASFEGTKGKLKRLKQVNKALDWFSPTSLRADLFSKSAGGTDIGVPNNIYGKEEPSDGDNYAGIIAYSYRGKDPRTYISKELKEKLEKGARYCVSYKVSLADLAKYAVNNLGAHLSRKPFEVEGKNAIKGLKLAFGPELWWGANPAVLLKYTKNLSGVDVTGIFHEDITQRNNLQSSFAGLGTPPPY